MRAPANAPSSMPCSSSRGQVAVRDPVEDRAVEEAEPAVDRGARRGPLASVPRPVRIRPGGRRADLGHDLADLGGAPLSQQRHVGASGAPAPSAGTRRASSRAGSAGGLPGSGSVRRRSSSAPSCERRLEQPPLAREVVVEQRLGDVRLAARAPTSTGPRSRRGRRARSRGRAAARDARRVAGGGRRARTSVPSVRALDRWSTSSYGAC